MEIVKKSPDEDMPVLLGVLSDKTPEGVIGFIIDPMDGQAIVRANCSDDGQAYFILGFGGEAQDSDETAYLSEVKSLLEKSFPEGYNLEWVGHWRNDPRTVKLCQWLDGTKLQRDDLYDWEVPERVILQNVDNAKKHSYMPNKERWGGERSKEFYAGMVAASRVFAGLIENCETQKELLERVNRIHLDAMIFTSQKSTLIKL